MSLFSKKEKTPSQTVVQDVLKTKKNERVLIIANPETNIIAQDLFSAFLEVDAKPVLMYQTKKEAMDYADESVVGALKSEPDIVLSISAIKLGKDKAAMEKPYIAEDGQEYHNTFDYLLSGKKCIRAVWTPGLTDDMFARTVNINYKQLADRCAAICKKYEGAKSIHVTSTGGTDITFSIESRKGLSDNGDFSIPGSGGNIPAGEVFISPVVGTSSGKIVFDGSMTFADGDDMLETPITVTVKDGYITDIAGGTEAARLLKGITAAEDRAEALAASSKEDGERAVLYKKNARNIGEFGIGLNPAASITGNMLEDEKAFRTCHFAVGENYDGDAPSFIHFDGLVRNPTVEILYENDKSYLLMKDGDLKL